MRRAWSSIRDAFNNLRRAPTMAFAIVVVSAISLALLGVGLMINTQVGLMKGYWYDRVEVSIFLAEDITDEQRTSLETSLEADPLVKKVFYETKEQAFELFKEQFESSPELTSEVTPDQLPESFRVSLVDPEQFLAIEESYSDTPGVDVVQDQRATLKVFFSILEGVQNAALTLALIQVGTALVLVSNTVRVAALARRREIRIMRLVGAPRTMIALPFILEGALAGFLGGVVSSLTLVGLKVYLIDGKLSSAAQSFSIIGWDGVLSAVAITMVVGVLLTTVASALSIFRHLEV